MFLVISMLTVDAAADTVVDINLFHSLNIRDTGSISDAYLMVGNASVSFKSPNSGNVRGDVDSLSHKRERPSFRISTGPTSGPVSPPSASPWERHASVGAMA
jgi:hypothetical protein